jgi:hypothetical protein
MITKCLRHKTSGAIKSDEYGAQMLPEKNKILQLSDFSMKLGPKGRSFTGVDRDGAAAPLGLAWE